MRRPSAHRFPRRLVGPFVLARLLIGLSPPRCIRDSGKRNIPYVGSPVVSAMSLKTNGGF